MAQGTQHVGVKARDLGKPQPLASGPVSCHGEKVLGYVGWGNQDPKP